MRDLPPKSRMSGGIYGVTRARGGGGIIKKKVTLKKRGRQIWKKKEKVNTYRDEGIKI